MRACSRRRSSKERPWLRRGWARRALYNIGGIQVVVGVATGTIALALALAWLLQLGKRSPPGVSPPYAGRPVPPRLLSEMRRRLLQGRDEPEVASRADLDSVYGPGVAGLARLSLSWPQGSHAAAREGVAEDAAPVVGCERHYAGRASIRLLAECLPYAPRGVLTMVEPREVSVRQAGEDLALASALGRAGFLVLLVAQESWPMMPRLPRDHVLRVSAGVFLVPIHGDAFFAMGLISPPDPVYGPVLLMGRTFGAGVTADPAAMSRAGARVYAVGRRDQPWVDAGGAATESEGAFLAWAACQRAVEGVVLRHVPSVGRLRSAAPCGTRVFGLESSVASRPNLPRDDAEAAQLAALLASDAVARAERDAAEAAARDGAALAAQRLAEDRFGADADADAQGTPADEPSSGRMPARQSKWRRTAGPHADFVVPRVPGPDEGPVPVRRDACGPRHSLVVHEFLSRCLPGRRGVFVQGPTVPWDIVLFQRPQHIARAMAESHGMLVVYEAVDRGRRMLEEVQGVRGVFAGDGIDSSAVPGSILSVYSTMRWCAARCVLDAEEAGVTAVFEYIDAIDEAVSGADNLRALREGLRVSAASASVVAYSAQNLKADLPKPREGSRTVLVPNGVLLSQYDVPKDAPVPKAMASMVASGRPVVGYFGAIAMWIWLELLHDVARLVPEADFVMIGNVYGATKQPVAGEYPENVHYLGSVPADELVLYARHWSVGIIPFRHGDVARTTSPLKLFEYFALGLPVVVTDQMTECTRFEEVRRASDSAGFAEQVRAAIRDADRPETAATMKRLAAQSSWEQRAGVILDAATSTIRERMNK